MQAANLTKARLLCMDDKSMNIDFQFNPSSLQFTRESGSSDDSEFLGPYGGEHEWDGGARDSMTATALVDTSVGGEIDLADATAFQAMLLNAMSAFADLPNEESVLPSIFAFYRLTLPIKPPDAKENEARTPVVVFVWEQFEFMGQLTSLECDMSLFDATGMAKRAELTLTLEGRAFSGGVTLADFLKGNFTIPDVTAGDALTQGRQDSLTHQGLAALIGRQL